MESSSNKREMSSHSMHNNRPGSSRRQGLEGESSESSPKSDEVSIWVEEILESDQEEPLSADRAHQKRNSEENYAGESILVWADRVLGKIPNIQKGKTQGQKELSPNPSSGSSRTDSDHGNVEVNTSNEDALDQSIDESLRNDNGGVSYQQDNSDEEEVSDEGKCKTDQDEPFDNYHEDQVLDEDVFDNDITETKPDESNENNHDGQSDEARAAGESVSFKEDVTETTPEDLLEGEDEPHNINDTGEDDALENVSTEITPVDPVTNGEGDVSHHGGDTNINVPAEDMNDDNTKTMPVESPENDEGDLTFNRDAMEKEDASKDDPTTTKPADSLENQDETQAPEISDEGENGSPEKDSPPGEPIGNKEEDLSQDEIATVDEEETEDVVIEPTPVDPFENNDGDQSQDISPFGEEDVSGEDITATMPRPVAPSENNEGDPSHDSNITDDTGESDEPPAEDNEEDFSHMGIASNVSDMDEIDLNSDEEDGNSATPVSQPSSPRRQPADIEAGESGESESHGATYFGTYVDVLYYIGISLRRGDGSNPLGYCNYIPFVLVAFIAILQILMILKNNIVFSEDDKDIILHCIEIGQDVNTFLLRVSFFCLIFLKISSIVESIKALGTLPGNSNKSRRKTRLVVGCLVSTSIATAILYPVLRIVTRFTESDSDLILFSSFDFATAILLWTKQNATDEIANIDELYGTTHTPATVTMGLTNILISFMGYAYEFFLKDASLVVACDLYFICSGFIALIDSVDAKTMTPDTAAKIWTQYKQIRNAAKQVNDCMEYIFVIMHAHNSFYVTYFFYDHFFLREDLLLTVPESHELVKILCFYGFAGMASLINTKFHSWIQSSFRGQNTPFIENGEQVQAMNLLHELETDPIGIGTGMFFIGGPFITKFITIVGSFIFFLRDINTP